MKKILPLGHKNRAGKNSWHFSVHCKELHFFMHFSLPLFLNWPDYSDGGPLELKALLVGFGQELSGELIQIFIDLLQGPHLLLQFRHSYLSVLPITKHTLTTPQRERERQRGEKKEKVIMTSFWQKQSSKTFWPMTFHFLYMPFPVVHDYRRRIFIDYFFLVTVRADIHLYVMH